MAIEKVQISDISGIWMYTLFVRTTVIVAQPQKLTCCKGGVRRSENSATFSSLSGFVITLKQCFLTEKLVASLSQSESEFADMEWWEGEKNPPEPKGNDSSELPA